MSRTNNKTIIFTHLQKIIPSEEMRGGVAIDQNIKGFNELSTYAQRLFQKTNKKHIEAIEDKASWTPIKVKEHQNHIEVHFKNGTWLHYLPDGTWY